MRISDWSSDVCSSDLQDWKAEWNHYRDCDSPGIGCGWTDFRSYDKWVTGTTTLDSVGGGVYAGTLNASGFGLTNAGSPYDAATTPDRKSANGAGRSEARRVGKECVSKCRSRR